MRIKTRTIPKVLLACCGVLLAGTLSGRPAAAQKAPAMRDARTQLQKIGGGRFLADGGISVPVADGLADATKPGALVGPSINHLGTVNVAYADGHVKALKANSFYYNYSWQLNPGCSEEGSIKRDGKYYLCY